MAEAMRRVREEFGEDAVIVQTREWRRPILGLFGRPYVEVTAGAGPVCGKPSTRLSEPPAQNSLLTPAFSASARDDRLELSGSSAPRTCIASPQLRALAQSILAKQGKEVEVPTEEQVRRDTLDAAVVLDQRLVSLDEKLGRLNSLIERVSWGQIGPVSACETDPWKMHLRAQDVEESLVDDILSAIRPPVSHLALRQQLIRRFPATGAIRVDNKGPGPKLVMLVGPTGVGKTTTLAKIAPGFTHPRTGQGKKVVFMTADLFRIAAVEQLHKYSEILRVPLEVVYVPEEAAAAIGRHQNADLILIDTGGTGQRNESQIANLAAIARACKPLEVHLVVSATTKSTDLADIIERFQVLEPQRLLITKLDESTRFGNILNAAAQSQLPISYLTTGQMVPEDIEVATSERLADLVLGDGGPMGGLVSISGGATDTVSTAGGADHA